MHSSKRKGTRFEQDIVAAARALGVGAQRAMSSNGRTIGHCEKVDLVLAGLRVQAKRRASLPAYLGLEEGIDAAVFRQDRGEAMVLLPLRTLLELLANQRERPADLGGEGLPA